MPKAESIVEITPVGYEETYDLEVDHPSHTFYANDISVSNSHALAYSAITYQCAYLATYYPIEWAVGYLAKETDRGGKDKETKKQQAIANVIGEGIEVYSPDINRSTDQWAINEDRTGIVAPLSLIKGLGSSALEVIMSNRPYTCIEDVLFGEKKLKKNWIDALIKARVFDSLVDDRFESLYHLWRVAVENKPNSMKKFEAGIELYRTSQEFTREETIENLVALTGIYPMEKVLNKNISTKLKELCVPPISEYDADLKFAWFVPTNITYKKTAKGRDYMILDVIDSNFEMNQIKCWSIKPEIDKIDKHCVYVGNLRYDDWGFSVNGIQGSMAKVE